MKVILQEIKNKVSELLISGKNPHKISKEISNISSTTIRNLAKELGIKNKVIRANVDRNKQIIERVYSGVGYEQVAIEFKITNARFQQIAKTFGYGKWKESQEKRTIKKNYVDRLKDEIENDFKNSLGYFDAREKYLKKINPLLNQKFGIKLFFIGLYKAKRDKLIVHKYLSGETARQIINSKDELLSEDLNVNSESQIYNIIAKQGFKKYINVGSRCVKGSHDHPKLIRSIKILREKADFTWIGIADYFNSRNIKTTQNRTFSLENVLLKYKNTKKDAKKR